MKNPACLPAAVVSLYDDDDDDDGVDDDLLSLAAKKSRVAKINSFGVGAFPH